MSNNDVTKWVKDNKERSERNKETQNYLFETGSADVIESLNSKSSDDVSNGDGNDSKMDDTSSTKSSEEDEKRLQKHKKDLLHRDIEKRRRDRINNSLTELRDLIPSAKTKIKCDGNTRTGRLQKAKLLELTVEYLKSFNPEKTRQNDEASKDDNKSKGDQLIAESAQQIYISAYKAGFSHALKQESKTSSDQNNSSFQIDQITVPPMFLHSEKSAVKNSCDPMDNCNGKRKHGEPDGIHIAGMTAKINENFKCEKSSVIQKSSSFSSPPNFNNRSELNKSNNERSLTEPHNKSIDAKAFSERGRILISSYVLNEEKTRYYPTVLPLSVLLEEQENNKKRYRRDYEAVYNDIPSGLKGNLSLDERLLKNTNTPKIFANDKKTVCHFDKRLFDRSLIN